MLQEEKFLKKKGVEEGTLYAVCFGDANDWLVACWDGLRRGMFELRGDGGAGWVG
jgi:hypothetical protein